MGKHPVKFTLAFTARDLANTRFTVSPLQHLVLGVLLQRGHSDAARRWWRQARRNVPQPAAPLVELIYAHPWYAPDFLTPPLPSSGAAGPSPIANELDALSATDPSQIEAELRYHRDPHGMPRRVLALRDGDSRELTRLVDAAHAMFRACLADDWPHIGLRLRADIAQRATLLATDGMEAMLAGLNCGWNSAEATLSFTVKAGGPLAPAECRVDLGGGGIILSPTLFTDIRASPITTPWQQAALVYPIRSGPPPAAGDTDGLSSLIGRGRAAALRAVSTGATTGELADRLHISAPAASTHASALRAAGLITTVRDGRRVRHTLTALGTALLDANPTRRV